MTILGIETSCDDTSVALVKKTNQGFKVLANVISSQIKTHAPFGGVVPNLAAREHLKNIKPCLQAVLKNRSLAPSCRSRTPTILTIFKIDAIAVTEKPGLSPSLFIGLSFAKALAYNWHLPLEYINHIHGHIYANWLEHKNIKFPALCLVVSGGHTQLVLMTGHMKFKVLGETRDDAAGEAFDKVAKLLNLGYPGGPIISEKASLGNANKFDLPRPMIDRPNYDFSFSGLKTAVLYLIKNQKIKLTDKNINDMSASFQQAVIDVLISKTIRAAGEYNIKSVLLAGGVAANKELRKQLEQAVKSRTKASFHMPSLSYCTDNAAMICAAAFYKQRPGR